MSQPYNILPTKIADRIANTFYYYKGELRWWDGKHVRNKEADSKRLKKYYIKNREEKKKKTKEYQTNPAYKKRANKRRRWRYKNDPDYRLRALLRNRFGNALRSENIKKRSHVLELTSCSMDFLRDYLSKQFEKGMSWENRGEWHVDHRKPCDSFDLRNEEEERKCFHYTNLQPLWGPENKAKGSTFNDATFEYNKKKKKGWVKN